MAQLTCTHYSILLIFFICMAFLLIATFFDQRNYRLPNNTQPIHYDIELTANFNAESKDFNGQVRIELKIIKNTRSIVLHQRKLRDFIGKIENAANKSESYDMQWNYEVIREFLTWTPKNAANLEFQAGEIWYLIIKYKGSLRNKNAGFFLSNYLDENQKPSYLAATQFESTDARHGFPCYDEPAKRATFIITINHDPAFQTISNMAVDVTKSRKGSTVFEQTPNMSPYLVAFIITKFNFTETVSDGIQQRIYSRPRTEGQRKFALTTAVAIMKWLNEYFDFKYPLPKIDQIAIPDFFEGAMENWGLCTFYEKNLLVNDRTSTFDWKFEVAYTIAHEFVHQWFGNLVCIAWWTYAWLKEGFASLYAIDVLDAIYSDWNVFQMHHVRHYQRALNKDAALRARPMTHYVQTPNEIEDRFSYISYHKAGGVLNMWRHALGEEVFQQALRIYLINNQYKCAVEDDLFEAIQIAAQQLNFSLKASIKDMLSSWTQQAGYPVLLVTRNYDKLRSFTIRQRRYFDASFISLSNLWYIPLNYATENDPNFENTIATHYLLKTRSITIKDAQLSNNAWLILNKKSTGFYRINYDVRNWRLISKALINTPQQIHPRNRAQLLDDAYHLSNIKLIKHDILLNMMVYLSKEDQYAPWYTANKIIRIYERYLKYDVTYTRFVKLLVANAFNRFGIDDRAGELPADKYTRGIIIRMACSIDMPNCLNAFHKKLYSKKNLDSIFIEPNVQEPIYCNVLRNANATLFDFFYNKWLQTGDEVASNILMASLACSENKQHLQKLMNNTIRKDSLQHLECKKLFKVIYSSGEIGLLTSIEFLLQHWQHYTRLNAIHLCSDKWKFNDVIKDISKYVINKKQKKKLLQLVNKVKNSSQVQKDLKSKVKANIAANSAWIMENSQSILHAMKQLL